MLTTAPKVLYAKKHSITGLKIVLHLLPVGGYAIVPIGPVFENIQSMVQKMTHRTKSPAVWQSVILKTNTSFFENTLSLAVDFPNPILQPLCFSPTVTIIIIKTVMTLFPHWEGICDRKALWNVVRYSPRKEANPCRFRTMGGRAVTAPPAGRVCIFSAMAVCLFLITGWWTNSQNNGLSPPAACENQTWKPNLHPKYRNFL